MNPEKISKFLSLVLRHNPSKIGIELDQNGWTNCQELIRKAALNGVSFDLPTLLKVVETNEKKRFSLTEDNTRIRANQGHSVKVDLALEKITPPEFLYHGTVAKFLESIRANGLVKGQRHHVHLSADTETASKVGERRGKPIILKIRANDMSQSGTPFYRSTNGVWLVDSVPPDFIEHP